MKALQDLLLIAVGSAFVNNVVLSQFLGICPFLGVSKNVKTAAGMGSAVVFVITIASFVTGLIYKFILGNPNILGGELSYLNTIVFILVIAALVQFVEMFLKKAMPSLYNALGVYLPLITTNCAVLGVALTNVQNGYYDNMSTGMGLLTGVINGFATAVGFLVSIVLMAGIREKIEYNDITESQRHSDRACYGRSDGDCFLWIFRINIGGRQNDYYSNYFSGSRCRWNRSVHRSFSWNRREEIRSRSG